MSIAAFVNHLNYVQIITRSRKRGIVKDASRDEHFIIRAPDGPAASKLANAAISTQNTLDLM
jgi:hypothetical protein